MTDDEKDHKQVPSNAVAVATDVSDRVPAGQFERRRSETERDGAGKSLLGEKVGSIRIVEYIGEGGFGEVYAGYDEKLDRKVALKALRSDRRLQAEARARFLREARMLSHLDHPNICRIHDLVAEKDRDFLILEFLTGTSLAKTIKKGCPRTLKFRIAEQVARALAAAHEKGIVHRDLKPENVMITSDHNDVKVLDFGLARPFVDSTDTTLDVPNTGPQQGKPQIEDEGGEPAYTGTRFGAVMGTPAYMSPEQARGESATPASDLYSFGLLVQELFSGHRPAERHLTAGDAVERAARGESLAFEDKDRDLTALVSRLKSFAPASRPSALDAAERLQWIAQKPRRLKLRFLAAGIAAILVATTTVAVVQGSRANRAAVRAEHEAQTTRQVADFLVSIFRVSDPGEARGKTVTAREILDRGAKKIETELKDQPLVQARLLDTMGTVYMGLGLYKDAEPLLSAALATREKALGPDHLDVAQSLNDLAELDWNEGKYAEAEPLFKRALAIREKALGPDHADVAQSLNDLAIAYEYQGKYAEAEPFYKRALAIREKALEPDHPEVAYSLTNLATLYVNQGKYAEAEPLLKRALAIWEKALGPDHPNVAKTLSRLASLYLNRGKYTEAEPLFKRALAISEKAIGPGSRETADALRALASCEFKERRSNDALDRSVRCVKIGRELAAKMPEDQKVHFLVGSALLLKGQIETAMGRSADAQSSWREALSFVEPVARGARGVTDLSTYSQLLLCVGRTDEARPIVKKLLDTGYKDPDLLALCNERGLRL